MNKNEKHAVLLILSFFLLGLIVRYVPWSLPEIGETPVEVLDFSYTESAPLLHSTQEESFKLKDSLDVLKRLPSKKKSSKPKVSFPVAINSASQQVLCAIPGVGPKLAEKIIEYRQTKGPLKNEKDLKKVQGIGDKKSKNMLPHIIFD